MNCYLHVKNTKTNQDEKINIEYNGNVSYTASIAIIDNYLSYFKDLDSFITYIYNDEQIDFIPDECYIMSNNKNKLEPIFGNTTIRRITNDILTGKQLHGDKNEVNELVKEIFSYTNNDEYQRILRSIANTKEVSNLYHDFSNNNINKIKLDLFLDYSLYRNLYVWFNNYKSKYHQEKKEEQDNQITLDQYLQDKSKPTPLEKITKFIDENYEKEIEEEKVQLFTPKEKEIEEPKVDYEDIEDELLKIAEERRRLEELRLKGIQTNEKIEYYYNLGGLPKVLEEVSLDEIEALTKDEQEYIGYRRR